MSEPQRAEAALPPGMRFDGDLMGYSAYHAAREPNYTQPEEREILEQIERAVAALKALGWRDAIYCPKDGTPFLVVEAGCTAVYLACYRGEWPQGAWFVQHAGDEWPSRPILFHPMRPAEMAGQATETQP